MNKVLLIAALLLSISIISSCGGEQKKPNKLSSPPSAAPIKVEKAPIDSKKQANSETNKTNNSKTNSTKEQQAQLDKAAAIIGKTSKKELDDINAAKLFKMHCAICHGFKGDMQINGAKDLTKSNITLQESIAQVYHGKGLMTPYKGVISDAEIVAVSKYCESLRK